MRSRTLPRRAGFADARWHRKHRQRIGSSPGYWENLRAGVESIRHLSETELLENGESPARMRHRNYVPAAAILDKFDHFDADLFLIVKCFILNYLLLFFILIVVMALLEFIFLVF